ncbi:MAG: hypothetical protein H6723_17785 [Sandaracinus sp.]|nr:hypothetical protein [Sandaracinus sp.]
MERAYRRAESFWKKAREGVAAPGRSSALNVLASDQLQPRELADRVTTVRIESKTRQVVDGRESAVASVV